MTTDLDRLDSSALHLLRQTEESSGRGTECKGVMMEAHCGSAVIISLRKLAHLGLVNALGETETTDPEAYSLTDEGRTAIEEYVGQQFAS